MSFVPGNRIGPYEILSPLGAGGMGEVYRARDGRIGRDVAIKVLHTASAADSDRLRRFEQEARAAGMLNHPNILTIYDIGHQDNAPYIVSELIQGEELRAQLSRGPLPPRKAMDYALQIANGLAAAHQKGIVHRDLKPANLFVTDDGRVKILDFGLAKLRPQTAESVNTEAVTESPLTDSGIVLGTVGYMSPEQVRGMEVDARTDIFNLGAVLYEMLAAARPFPGASYAEVMSAILKDDPPDIDTTSEAAGRDGRSVKREAVPLQLERIVRRCLQKKPELRFQSASDLAFAIESASSASGRSATSELAGVSSTDEPAAGRRTVRERIWIGIALLSVTAALALAYRHSWPVSTDLPLMKLSVAAPAKVSFGSFAVSPDGRWLAFAGASGGKEQLWVRALDSVTARVLPGTEGAYMPFWSPDSRSIGFFALGKLKRVAYTGGPVRAVCDVGVGWGGTWNQDGVIAFGTTGSGLFRVPAGGGEPSLVIAPDGERREAAFHSPFFLPDGRHLLYCVRSGRKDTRGIYVISLDGAVKQRVVDADSNGVYAEPGYLLFGRDGALLAQPFEVAQMRVTGEPVPVGEAVGSVPNINHGNFSASANGILVYDPSLERQGKALMWVDRVGKPLGRQYPAGSYSITGLAPDEKQAAVDRLDSQTETYGLWIQDMKGGPATRFTFDQTDDIYPVWSPDGGSIVWSSFRQGLFDLYRKAASGAGRDEMILTSALRKFPTDWSRDGRLIVYYEVSPKTKRDIWTVPVTGDRRPVPFLQSEANEIFGQLSPDGQWMAYSSDESGSYEVYVQSFPAGGSKRQISTSGGTGPRWRLDGKELFYYSTDGKMMAVEIKRGAGLEAGVGQELFEFRSGAAVAGLAPFAVSADGNRFLLNTLVDESGGAPLTIVLNWTATLKH